MVLALGEEYKFETDDYVDDILSTFKHLVAGRNRGTKILKLD